MVRRSSLTALFLLSCLVGCTTAETGVVPEIDFFRSDLAETVTEGEVLLSWSVRGATELHLEEAGEVLEEGLPMEGQLAVHPAGTRSYRLVATGSQGTAFASLTVRVLPAPPLIRWFSTDSRRLGTDEQARLHWKVERASRVRLTDALGDLDVEATGPSEGQALVQPLETTAYTLIAENAAGESRATLVLGVYAGPHLAFWSDRPVVALGEAATLTWEATGATGLTIRGASEVLVEQAESRGSHRVTPERTTLYRALAVGEGGERQVLVRVEVSPAIDLFQLVNESPRRVGSPAEVRWSVRGADAIELSDAEGHRWIVPRDRLEEGSKEVPVPADGVLWLTAWRDGVPARRKLHVPLTEGPRIQELQARAGELTPDGRLAATLSWKVEGAASLELLTLPGGAMELGEVDLREDEVRIPISQTTVFRLTARNPKGSHTRFARVEFESLEDPAPKVSLFRVEPALAVSGTPLRFVWETVGASTLRICPAQGACFCEEAGERVPKGECVVPAPSGDGTRQVTLHVSDPEGRTGSRSAQFTVMDEARIPWVSARPSPSFVDTVAGTSALLQWTSRNAQRVEIVALTPEGLPGTRIAEIPLVGDEASGSLPVQPHLPPLARYRITATNALGWPTHTEVAVRVDPATLEAFHLSALQVQRGEGVDLHWGSARASEVLLEREGLELGRAMPWSPVESAGALSIEAPPLGEEAVVEFPEGFTFPWGGERRGFARVSSQGTLAFSWESLPLAEENRHLPAADLPPFLAPFWDSALDPKESGRILVELRADEEGRVLVVEWRHFQFAESTVEEPADLNFQVWLRESGAFEFRYGEMMAHGSRAEAGPARANGAHATIGYQWGESEGRSLSYRQELAGGLGERVWAGGRSALGAEGSLRLLPQVSTRYRIVASNPHSSDEGSLEIQVLP